MSMRQTLVAAATLFSLAGIAHADDARLLTRLYNPADVVVLEGRAGVQATIVFGDDEHIENVAIGDSTSWQVTPNKRANLLFVKPLGQKARTNMTVVTDRHMYVFDLVANATGAPFYVLRFTYPDEPKPAPRLAGGVSAEEAQAVSSPPQEATPAAPTRTPPNFAWRSEGSRKLMPSRIYDDGVATYLLWPPLAAIPAILTRNEKGQEGAVNYAVRGDVLVLDSVPRTIVLRAGRDMATLENKTAPPPEATAPKLTAMRTEGQ
jgi:type IV secretion system protein VirB9